MLRHLAAGDGRTAHRAARHHTGAAAGAGYASATLRMHQLRWCSRGSAGARTADRWRHGDRGADRACGGEQILRWASAVSPIANAEPPRGDAGPIHIEQLGGPGLLVADAAI